MVLQSTTPADTTSGVESFPRSRVAPDIGDESLLPVSNAQDASTMPGATGPTSTDTAPLIPNTERGIDVNGEKVGFMDRAKGFAKLNAGKVFGNDKEVAIGEAALRGEDVGQKQH